MEDLRLGLCLVTARGSGLDGLTKFREQRQLGLTEGGLVYAAVVAGRAVPQQPSGPHKPPAKGSDHSKPLASSETTTRRVSLADMSGPLCVCPMAPL